MFLKLFTLQLFLLFKSVPKIAWSGAFWFAFRGQRRLALHHRPGRREEGSSARKRGFYVMRHDAYILKVKQMLGWFQPVTFFSVCWGGCSSETPRSLCASTVFSLHLFTTTETFGLGLHPAHTGGPTGNRLSSEQSWGPIHYGGPLHRRGN